MKVNHERYYLIKLENFQHTLIIIISHKRKWQITNSPPDEEKTAKCTEQSSEQEPTLPQKQGVWPSSTQQSSTLILSYLLLARLRFLEKENKYSSKERCPWYQNSIFLPSFWPSDLQYPQGNQQPFIFFYFHDDQSWFSFLIDFQHSCRTSQSPLRLRQE